MTEYAVLDVGITGQSATPFHYSEGNFAVQYADSDDPYRTYVNTRAWGVNPADWTRFSPSLRDGTVTQGQEVHGTAPIVVSMHARVLVFMTDDSLTNRLAQWLTTSS